MADASTIVRERQKAIRREMNRRGIAVKAVQMDGGWDSPSTVLSYFPEDATAQPAVMSMASFYRLFNALPVDLLSLMLPNGFQVVRAPDEIDHDEIERLCREYLDAKGKAHRKDSPGGTEVTDGERDNLDGCALRLVGGIAA